MAHQFTSGVPRSRYAEMKEHMVNANFMHGKLFQIYEQYSSMSSEEIGDMLDDDIYWDVDKAIKNGLVDEAYTPEIRDAYMKKTGRFVP